MSGRPLVGGLSFHGVSGPVHVFTGTSAARRNSGPGREKAADAGLGLLLGISTTPWVALRRGLQRGPDPYAQ